MIVIGEYDGFKIFEPAPEIIPESKVKVDTAIEANRKYLENLPSEKKREPVMRTHLPLTMAPALA